jgi:tetratricopeptide (TPR) repeat protein
MQLTPVQKQEMKQHYEKATRAYDVQKYSEAVEEYQKAYEIGGDPAMLYNVAQSYRLSDQLPEALRFYRRYLQRSPNARNREDVERKISDLERTLEERRKAAAAVPPPPPPEPVVVPPPPPPKPVKTGGGGKRIAGIVLGSGDGRHYGKDGQGQGRQADECVDERHHVRSQPGGEWEDAGQGHDRGRDRRRCRGRDRRRVDRAIPGGGH